MAEKKDNKMIADNRKARHDYFVEEVYEAGIELFGTEVKSLRAGTVNLKDSYCTVRDGEIFACGIHISPYEKGNIFNRDPLRDRRLLMHKKEILKLHQWLGTKGGTLIPLRFYLKGGLIKVELAYCQGKTHADQRETLRKRDSEKEMRRAMLK